MRCARCLLRAFLGASFLLTMGLAACDDPGSDGPPAVQPDPDIGATSFYSAVVDDGRRGDQDYTPLEPGSDEGQNGGAPDERVVEEGDIYRLLGGGLVLNLNAWRGLQVLDLSDPEAPEIIGRLRLSGDPLELYVVDGRYAVLLMNRWQGWYAAPEASAGVQTHVGGMALLVDLSDPAAPVVADVATVDGTIRTSRLVSGGGQAALYLAASDVSWWDGGVPVEPGVGADASPASEDATLVRSFEVVGGALAARSEVDLGGFVADIHATPEALLVARTDWSDPGSRVSVVDISDPAGAMVEGAEVTVSGRVESQFNMDIRGDVLRVVSDDRSGETGTNHLETFDVSDVGAPAPLDHETFGEGEQLYATLFLEDRAFFVTYFVQDPFHAFEIGPDGDAIERAEFVVSGWNDFFRAAFGETRLVGVGVDDAGGARRLALSLYDITDLANPEPLVERDHVDLESAWSEASWDHRAFAVLEGAVDVDGETALVMLPFEGWDGQGYRAGVQLFTLSPDTVTPRGVLEHDSPVRRSFLAGEGTGAALSELSLGLHDVTDPDAPVALGSLELAPAYADVLIYGDHGVRLVSPTEYTWYSADKEPPPWRAEVVSLAQHPDTAPALASLEVPPGASLVRVGDLLVSVAQRYDPAAGDSEKGWVTDVAVWDLTQPASPEPRGTLQTTRLQPGTGGSPWPGGIDGPTDAAWWGGWVTVRPQVVGEALVFAERRYESEAAGTKEICVTTPVGSGGGTEPGGSPEPTDPQAGGGSGDETPGTDPDEEPREGEPYYVGSIECVTEDGGEPYCRGEIWRCEWFEEGCEPVDPDTVQTETSCREEPLVHTWQRWVLHVLDLRDPNAPALGEPLEMPSEDEGVTTVPDGTTLWYSYRHPYDVEGDPRPYAQYFVRRVDLSDPASPAVGGGVNVPGRLLLAMGGTLYTQDWVYADTLVESAVSRLELGDGVATLMARHRFGDRAVEGVELDGAGLALVAHRDPWASGGGGGVVPVDPVAVDTGTGDAATEADGVAVRLTVLSAQALEEQATVDVADQAELRAALPGRALFQVPGGMLVYDLDVASAPQAQAFLTTRGWPRAVRLHERDVLFAAGRYGIYVFDLDEVNLLAGEVPTPN